MSLAEVLLVLAVLAVELRVTLAVVVGAAQVEAARGVLTRVRVAQVDVILATEQYVLVLLGRVQDFVKGDSFGDNRPKSVLFHEKLCHFKEI